MTPERGKASAQALGRWFRTTARLEPAQVYQRIRLRTLRELDRLGSGQRRFEASRAPELRVLPVVSRERHLHHPLEAEELARGSISVLHHDVASPGGQLQWFDPTLPRLALMHLHYMDWLWAFHAHPDREWASSSLLDILASWSSATTPGGWMAWHPYVVACRGWNLCQVLPGMIGSPGPEFRRLVWFHGAQLRRNLELDVRGNHLVRDLRALVALGLCVGKRDWLTDALTGLSHCVDEQILSDGGHHERSPYYHVQVLVDLEEVNELLSTCGELVPPFLPVAIDAMQQWLATRRPNAEDLPVFNDGLRRNERSPVQATSIEAIPAPTLVEPGASGYGIIRRGPWWVAMDLGDPAPRHLPAHGHCSLLSVEVFHDDKPLLVNTGSSTYDDFAVRAEERGTRAHNTVRLDNTEQSEIWDRFRIGRQASAVAVFARDDDRATRIGGSHDGYDLLAGSPRHSRSVTVDDECVVVADSISGSGDHLVEGCWRLAPTATVHTEADGTVSVDGTTIVIDGPVTVTVVPADDPDADHIALDYGLRRNTTSIRWRYEGPLPLDVETTIRSTSI